MQAMPQSPGIDRDAARGAQLWKGSSGRSTVIAIVLAAGGSVAMAQTPVYETRDKSGPVFSDKPSPGASSVEVPPPNVIEIARPAPAPPTPAPAAPPPYRVLQIRSLPNDGTIHSNTGAFDLKLQVAPALRTGAGDRIQVVLDGQLLGRSFSSNSVHIAAEDWRSATNADEAAHSVAVVIVDKTGAILIESPPVSFYVRRATVHRGR